jgi:hypothetical protein
VRRVRNGDGEGGVVLITRAGAREAGERGTEHPVSARSAAPRTAVHGRAVSWVAASADVRGWQWFGPAEMRVEGDWDMRREDGATHSPDLIVVRGDTRTAIEVELHTKAPKRLEVILRAYRALLREGGLEAVSYVTDRRDVAALVRRQVEEVGIEKAVQLGPLESIVAGTRSARDERLRASWRNSLS